MTIARNAGKVLSRHVTLELECLDRLYLNAYVPMLQTPGGAAHFFRAVLGNPVPSSALMAPMTRSFVAAIERFAKTEGLDLIAFERGERKDDRTQKYLRGWHGGEGVLYIGKAQERARVLRTRRCTGSADGPFGAVAGPGHGDGEPLLPLRRRRRLRSLLHQVLLLFPLQRQAVPERPRVREAAAGEAEHPVRPLDNGILSCARPELMQEIAREVTADRIDALFRKWLARLPHAFTPEDRARGIHYELSILQAECALTQVFDRPLHGRLFFEEVMRENLDLGRPDNVQLIFERRVSRRTPTRYRTRVITDGVTPSLHIDYKRSRIKQYYKEGRALHTETVINNSYDFGIGRLLRNLEDLQKIGFAANRCLLRVQRLSHDCPLGAELFDGLHRPEVVDDMRAAALRFGDARVQAVLSVMLLFTLLPMDFRNR